ncbi:MAG: alpha-glucan family phosphorylase [Alistipes sp.]|nr:alpha-glucan family phosphorylase [Candidatus Alistipes equi]
MSNDLYSPDYLFEISWEVCNKVGGIHTVVATKALTVVNTLGDKYITIGPDFPSDLDNEEFVEDFALLSEWKNNLYNNGIRVRIGRWSIPGNPISILIDFTSVFSKKDEILKALWEDYRVDSISGQWDYVEPVLFGYLAGQVIQSYYNTFCQPTDQVVAHFHEWMTCSGSLYLRKNSPYVSTVMTTHATVMGRCIAGNHMPLYGKLSSYNADDLARKFNVTSKHSIEKIAANTCDAFVTVSNITANECQYLLSKSPDVVTPNGFENDFVWKGEMYDKKRSEARKSMIKVAEACLGYKFEKEPLIIGTSGRYEFRNKGLDVFLDALKKLTVNSKLDREILVYVTVPAANNGPRVDLQAFLNDSSYKIDPSQYRYSTHYLENIGYDQIASSINGSALDSASSKIKVLFVPTYLNKNDGIFNKDYYELLVGMDLTVYPSYYEPWGYTPLESIAFGVPTITSSLAGFGAWAKSLENTEGIFVLERTDDNFTAASVELADLILNFIGYGKTKLAACRKSTMDIAKKALWSNLFSYYLKAYDMAIESAIARTNKASFEEETPVTDQISFVSQQVSSLKPSWQRVMVMKYLPERLQALEELSRNMWWCWTLGAREMFQYIDPKLWEEVGHNPIALIDKLSLEKMQSLENDTRFLGVLDDIYAKFKAYMNEKPDEKAPKIAYFSMEYGLHHTLKIYSGGLGILAGDYLKEASDKNVPLVAVGLLYRYGYFTQRLSAQGAQEANYEPQEFSKLPIRPARDENGSWITVHVAFPGRTLNARVWLCQVGRTPLYLLDTDYEANIAEDRCITHYLYGGDWENRLKQEILLGIGGIRALSQLGIKQDVYHCNEGHAAFIGIERINNLIHRKKLAFSEALEIVRASSLFTTHTPVPAGHDAFPESMIRQYMSHYPSRLGLTWEQYINLGKFHPNDPNDRFSMSVLACNLSQEVNGVSWLHGEVSKDILGSLWPGYFKNELHIGYVTNGVHFPTWAASNMRRLYARYFPEGFSNHVYDIPAWQKVYDIPDSELWSEKMALKEQLINFIKQRYANPAQIRFDSPRHLLKVYGSIKPDILTIGFARRFATYKRAHLLFTNIERLSKIVNNPDYPVQFLFAGKAHPNDKPGQDLIKRIVEVSRMPEFLGKIIFLENYDMDVAHRLVQGVDVWLNTPTRPLEASGTSGEKCVMNGTMQFSVLDGWWVEGYREGAGWALPMEQAFADTEHQNELDAEMLYNIIEEQIVPLYYRRGQYGLPTDWIHAIKKCIADIASNFTTNRMIIDYEERFYNKLAAQHELLSQNNFRKARELATWKHRVTAAWNDVKIISTDKSETDAGTFVVGNKYTYSVSVDIASLSKEDVGVELVMATQRTSGDPENVSTFRMVPQQQEGSVVKFSIEFIPEMSGIFDVALRVFPHNELLAHRMDFALVKWA